MRQWSIALYILGPDGEELPANCFDKVTYKLHESFGNRAKQGEKRHAHDRFLMISAERYRISWIEY